LKFWPLQSVLQEKYLFDEQDALEVASFLEPLLEVHSTSLPLSSLSPLTLTLTFRLILIKERLPKNAYNIHGLIWSTIPLQDHASPFQERIREVRIKEVMTVTLKAKEIMQILLMRNLPAMMIMMMIMIAMTTLRVMTIMMTTTEN
jgi:hypothetical protein